MNTSIKLTGAGIVLATMGLVGCSTQSQVEKPQVVTKKVYVAKKHCHTFKGYGWAKRVCHAHPAPHRHTKPAPKRRPTRATPTCRPCVVSSRYRR